MPAFDGLSSVKCRVSAYRVPTDRPESDGTLRWDATTLVLVEIAAGGQCGVGYTYSSAAAATLIRDQLFPAIDGTDPLNTRAAFDAMVCQTRNLGRPGIVSMGISAVDGALWDLKSKLLNVPLVALLGSVRDAVPVYGSGGFTSYSDDELSEQARGWVESGIARVKMKVGREPQRDLQRVAVVRAAIGAAELFVDANGAYSRKQALAAMQQFADLGVTWMEEPVSSDDIAGLRLIRDANIPGMEVTTGEYGFHPPDFLRLLQAGAVDVLQADATRCGGVTGFLEVAALCNAFQIPLSSHCAPSLHAPLGCAVPNVRHIEYFHDHARIERMLFDGFVEPQAGVMRPSRDRPGWGLAFKHRDAEAFRIENH